MEADQLLSVVVAEDDYLVSMEVVRAAQAAGFKVLGVAANGVEAVEMVTRLRPHAAILDIRMPLMDGLEAAAAIRLAWPTPIVLLTAFESPEFLHKAKECGVGAYLTKPPEPGALFRAVELAVARHGDLMELVRINGELKEALARVKTLSGLLPICASCKKIRDDRGYWQQVEGYIQRHTEAQFSHGLCPECIHRLYPDIADELDK